MNLKRFMSLIAVVAAALTTPLQQAQAAATYDAHGNVGYDTAAECDAAVQSGNVKFYQSFTHKPPLIRSGESKVQVATLKDLGDQYAQGACDLGVGHKLGRDGVSKILQGKYIPFSPDMPVNVYTNASGKAVRVTMKQCDNWFSGNAPRPVDTLNFTQPKTTNTTVDAIPSTTVATAPIVTSTPVLTTAAIGLGAYAFGTLGAHTEKLEANGKQPNFYKPGIFNDRSTTGTAQVGLGYQFTPLLGGEIYVEGGQKKQYVSTTGTEQDVTRYVVGTDVTLGKDVIDEKLRLFLKAGVAAVHQDDFHPQFTVGVGCLYKLTNNTALRCDYTHYIKRSPHVYYDNMQFNKSHYGGLGFQYFFK